MPSGLGALAAFGCARAGAVLRSLCFAGDFGTSGAGVDSAGPVCCSAVKSTNVVTALVTTEATTLIKRVRLMAAPDGGGAPELLEATSR